MTVKEVLLLGNPRLLEKSEPVTSAELDSLNELYRDLRDTCHDFQRKYGAGRAIAAPQIGVMKQVVYSEYASPELLVNPVLSEKSREMVELWDDCMSFPDILVRVKRHKTCKVAYRNEAWEEKVRLLSEDESELLQHEIDHLHGILATMRAVDNSNIIYKTQKPLWERSSE